MHIFSAEFSSLLKSLIQVTGDWTLAIALITLATKVILFPLAVKQHKAMLFTNNLNDVKTFLTQNAKNRTDQVNDKIAKIITRYRINPFLPLISLVLQAPVIFSLYFSLMNLSTAVGSSLIPWVVSVSSPDSLHILPVLGGFFQGLSGFSGQAKNILYFILPIGIGIVFLWKAPAALSVYWVTNSLCGFFEKKILALKVVQRRLLKVVSVEEMISSIS